MIATSPTYCLEMSGQFKTFFDHMAYRWAPHRPHPAMWKKAGFAISSTVGAGAAKVARTIERQFYWWLIPRRYRFSMPLQDTNWNEVSEKNRQRVQRHGAELDAASVPGSALLFKPSQRILHFILGMAIRS